MKKRRPACALALALMLLIPALGCKKAETVWGAATAITARPNRTAAAAEVGDPAPGFVLKDTAGREYRLRDHIGKSPIVLQFGSFT